MCQKFSVNCLIHDMMIIDKLLLMMIGFRLPKAATERVFFFPHLSGCGVSGV